MAGLIPDTFINDVLTRTDLVELISARMTLKKSGSNHMGCCPFHHEKTPSFSVSAHKQLYHCFGCGASGNAISFLMEHDRLDFVSTIEELAARLGMEVPRDKSDKGPDLRPLYELLANASLFYQNQLKQPQNQHAISYLKNRGLTGEVVKQYGIGYAPEGWDNLIKSLGISDERCQQLATTGMAISKDKGGFYDRFRERIMFPIIDRRGRTIGFGGRILDKGEPKYLNSPETPLFHKSREVYGLYQVLQSNNKLEHLLVVEGYMDVVALAQFGVQYAVATLGTSLNAEHLQLLFRHCGKLVFCFDGDKAGRSAAWRALQISLEAIKDGRQLQFLFLPDGEDPDSLIRIEGKKAFEQRVSQAMPLSRYMQSHLSEQCDMTTIDGRSQLASLAKPLIAKINDPVYRDLLNQEFQKLTGTNQSLAPQENYSSNSQGAHFSNPRYSQDPYSQRSSSASKSFKKKAHHKAKPISLIRKTIGLLLQNPQHSQQLENWDWLTTIKEPGANLLFELLTLLQQNPELNTGALIEHWRGTPSHAHLTRLINWQQDLPDQDHKEELNQSMAKLAQKSQTHELQALLDESRIRPLTTQEKLKITHLLSQKK